MRRKEMTNLLEERAERILLLEQRMENQNQQLEGYRAREQSIVESFTSAQTEARQRVEAAQVRAAELVQEAERQAGAAMAAAQAQVDAMLAEAQAQANRILNAAQAESADMMNKTRQSCAEHEEWNAQYSALLATAAAQAKAGAEQFAAILKKCGVETPKADAEAGREARREQAQVELPDAENDPAKLMQNIYTLQNRDIPESVRPRETVVAVAIEEEAQQGQEGEGQEEIPDLAPRPEAEWQPEAEPEMEDIPTVSELMPDMGGDELSLDALLDEIIKAGE